MAGKGLDRAARKVAKKRPRLFRYEVTEIDGDAPVKVGDVIVDKWKSPAVWTVYNFTKEQPYVGSWAAKSLGEAPPDVAEQVYAKWNMPKPAEVN